MKNIFIKLFNKKTTKKSNEQAHIGEWFYSFPDTTPDKDGNIVLKKMVCFGPLEVYEWGININNEPYELYQWCENEILEDTSYNKTISWKELDKQLRYCIGLFDQEGLAEWKDAYENTISWLDSYKKSFDY